MPSTRPLNFAAAVITFLAFHGPCFAAGDATRSCIQKASEAVSSMPGMRVKKASTRAPTAEQMATWKGQSKPIMIDIDFVSPDESGTYSYICATSPSGQAFVRRVVSP
jgi:hypothetical protein